MRSTTGVTVTLAPGRSPVIHRSTTATARAPGSGPPVTRATRPAPSLALTGPAVPAVEVVPVRASRWRCTCSVGPDRTGAGAGDPAASVPPRAGAVSSSVATWVRVRAYWGSARTPTALARRTRCGSGSPSRPSPVATWSRAVSNATASGVSVTAVTAVVPSRRSSSHTPRFSAAASARRAASAGSNRSTAASTALRIRPSDNRCAYAARWVSTQPAASPVNGMVCSATWRAFHAGRSPVITRSQHNGNRSRSSSA